MPNHDTLVLIYSDKQECNNVLARMKKYNIGTKSLPEALNWHFAGEWNHIYYDTPRRWEKTRNILERSIALPVNILMTKADMDKTISVING